MNVNNFIAAIIAEMVVSVNNNYTDNYDYYRFGELPISKKTFSFSVKKKLVKKLNDRSFFNNIINWNFSNQITNTYYPFSDFLYLYEILEDDYSKELLIKLIAYRILGHTKVKLPLNTPSFWNNQKWIETNQSKVDFVSFGRINQKLPFTNLDFLGVPIALYYSALGINIDFIIKQYEFHRDGISVQAEKGDFVIDAGACFGDTALYFANKVGNTGMVKAFEFIPKNIEIFNKNINLNPVFQPLIELISNPLWSESNRKVFFADNGPSSKVAFEYFEKCTGETTTITIDDYVKSAGLVKVDLIKMDIEGAETNALQGAIESIKTFRPKLAIAIYHSTKDFHSIPKLINELNLGYKFYISHSTIYGEETMLFAKTVL